MVRKFQPGGCKIRSLAAIPASVAWSVRRGKLSNLGEAEAPGMDIRERRGSLGPHPETEAAKAKMVEALRARGGSAFTTTTSSSLKDDGMIKLHEGRISLTL